jgi:hypothetical protein
LRALIMRVPSKLSEKVIIEINNFKVLEIGSIETLTNKEILV